MRSAGASANPCAHGPPWPKRLAREQGREVGCLLGARLLLSANRLTLERPGTWPVAGLGPGTNSEGRSRKAPQIRGSLFLYFRLHLQRLGPLQCNDLTTLSHRAIRPNHANTLVKGLPWPPPPQKHAAKPCKNIEQNRLGPLGPLGLYKACLGPSLMRDRPRVLGVQGSAKTLAPWPPLAPPWPRLGPT